MSENKSQEESCCKCPNSFGSSFLSKKGDQFVVAELPCKKNRCPFCFHIKKENIIENIQERIAEVDQHTMYMYTLKNSRNWAMLSRQITRKKGRYMSIELSSDRPRIYKSRADKEGVDPERETLICSTVKPTDIEFAEIRTDLAGKAMVDAVEKLGTITRLGTRPYNSSRPWAIKKPKDDSEEKEESLSEHVCNSNVKDIAKIAEAVFEKHGFPYVTEERKSDAYGRSTFVRAKVDNMTKGEAAEIVREIRRTRLEDIVRENHDQDDHDCDKEPERKPEPTRSNRTHEQKPKSEQKDKDQCSPSSRPGCCPRDYGEVSMHNPAFVAAWQTRSDPSDF